MVSLAMAAGEISSVLAPVMSSTLWHAEHLSTKLFGLHKEHGGAGFPGYDVPMPRTTLKSKSVSEKMARTENLAAGTCSHCCKSCRISTQI